MATVAGGNRVQPTTRSTTEPAPPPVPTGRPSPMSGSPRSRLPGDARASQARHPGHVGSDHFHQIWLDNMPQFLIGKAPFYNANFYNEEREFGLPRMLLRGHETCRLPAAQRDRRRVRPRVQQRTAGRPQHHLPDHHPAARGRPADRPRVHQHLRPAHAAARQVRAARPGHQAMVESWPSDQRVAIIGTGHLSLELGGPGSSARMAPIRSSTARPCSGSRRAT